MFDPNRRRNIAENDTFLVLHFIELILPPLANHKKRAKHIGSFVR
jgi:hypothetical protein